LAASESRNTSLAESVRAANQKIEDNDAAWRARMEEREQELEAEINRRLADTNQQLLDAMNQLDKSQRNASRMQRALEDANINPVTLKPLADKEKAEQELQAFKVCQDCCRRIVANAILTQCSCATIALSTTD
jgi:flagellar hook-basal body complex protein FliE